MDPTLLEKRTNFPIILLLAVAALTALSPRALAAPAPEAVGMTLRFELFVMDAPASAEFYTRVLGFQCSGQPGPYIVARCGSVQIGISNDSSLGASHYFSPEALAGRKGVGTEIVLGVENLEAFYQRVVDSGYPILEKLARRPWGLRDFRLADPDGYYLRITEKSAAPATVATSAQTPPPWAYPFDPPGLVNPKDDGTIRHVPESPLGMTLSQVRDGYAAPDWHPDDHPAMPEVVVHGRKPAVMACGYCHRAEGTGGPENTSLAGLSAAYITQQMADFKSGARSTSVPLRAPPKNMIAGAKAATAEEIEAAANYFSSLKPRKIIQVVEAETVPKTEVEGWHLIDLKNGETEPLGQRIVEFPEDLQQFVSRDSRAQFIAYVPPGSIEKGKALATSPGDGRTVQCTICHGPDLKGVGPIPALAGRSPSYLVRQLYDFQSGARAGLGSALMKPAVEKLGLDDMISLAAYAASLMP